jgi:hypothetical protein
MPDPNSVPLFRCKSCVALYQVIKTQAGPETIDPQIACPVCNGLLAAREGQFVLKYFLLREASRLDARRARQGFLRAKPTTRRKNASNIKRPRQVCRGRVDQWERPREEAETDVYHLQRLRHISIPPCGCVETRRGETWKKKRSFKRPLIRKRVRFQ